MAPLPEPEADLDAPTSSKTALGSSRSTEAVAGADGDGGAASDSGEDEVPDYRMVSLLVRASKKAGAGASGSGAAYIPKRGEKDFEPTGVGGQNRALEESRRAMDEVIRGERSISSKALSHATWEPNLKRAIVHIVRGQMFNGLGTMVRRPKTAADLAAEASRKGKEKAKEEESPLSTSHNINQAKLERQALHNARLELLPEEALFLVERGSLLCYVRREGHIHDFSSEAGDRSGLEPMSVQQAFATMIGSDGCTRERYQVYAYLKRLGYYVQRASVADELRKVAASTRSKPVASSTIRTPAFHQRVWKSVYALFLQLLRIPLLVIALPYQGAAHLTLAVRQAAQRVATALQRKPRRSTQGLLGLGTRKWDNYNSVFSALQIVPSGHDSPPVMSRVSAPTESAVFSPYAIYYYAWRPATTYKKSDPPPPEFRIAIVDARSTALPRSHEFSEMFNAVPIPKAGSHQYFRPKAIGSGGGGPAGGDEEDDDSMDEDERRMRDQARKNAEAYGKIAAQRMREKEAARVEAKVAKERKRAETEGRVYEEPPALAPAAERRPYRAYVPQRTLMQRAIHAPFDALVALSTLFAHLPPGASSRTAPTLPYAYHTGTRPPNPFPPLKAGRRNVVLAVVDSGTTSIFRFGEAEFDKWRLAGEGGAGDGTAAKEAGERKGDRSGRV